VNRKEAEQFLREHVVLVSVGGSKPARCYACDAAPVGVRDRRPEGGRIEDACGRHAQKFVGGEPITRKYLESLNGAVRDAAEGDPGEQAEPPRRGTVLVVDDEAPIRRSLARLLRGSGWRVVTADGPVAAGELLCPVSGVMPDVVLSDWDMPDGGGELVALHASGLPVVFHTGRPEAPPAGTRVLCKPASVEDIDAALVAAVKGGR